jgi:microcystin-dependent protein
MDFYIGSLMLVPYNFIPHGWAWCNGQAVSVGQNAPLYALMGPTFGTNGPLEMRLPDLTGSATDANGAPLKWIIALRGFFPSPNNGPLNNSLRGSLLLAPYSFSLPGFALCNGQTLEIASDHALFSLLGLTFGGQYPTTFALPNLPGPKTPGEYSDPALKWFISTTGRFPSPSSSPDDPGEGDGQEDYLGSLLLVASSFVPSGWAACKGQTLAVSRYPRLFDLIGMTFGGDGVNTFAVPNLTGSKAITDASGTPLTWVIATSGAVPPKG